MDPMSADEYYKYLYPYETLVAWLTMHGHALERFEIAIDCEYYKRFVSARTVADLKKEIAKCPNVKAFHIGGIWPDACDRRTAPTQRIFSIDIDLTDYDYLQIADRAGNVCMKRADWAYPVAAFAISVLRYLLKRAFGFHQIYALYSGRRGVHVHVMDPAAIAMNAEARAAVAGFMNISYCKGQERASSYVRNLAKMYGLLEPSMDAFTHTLVGKMDLFGDIDQRVQFVKKLDLRHNALNSLEQDVMEDDLTGPAAWELIQKRVEHAGVAWFKERLMDTVLFYVWPHMDEKVSTDIGHLIKAPFCAHPKARRVAVALCAETFESWTTARAPHLDALELSLMDASLAHFVPRGTNDVDMEDAVLPSAAPAPVAPRAKRSKPNPNRKKARAGGK